jgi:lysophospholipase L1-like esterase
MLRSERVLLVYGDSLSLPRTRDGVGCFDTYPELLRASLESAQPGSRVAVLNRSRGGTAIADLYSAYVQDTAYFGAPTGVMLVIQCGIVDCAPRPISPKLKARIARLPTAARWAVAKFLHHARPYLLKCGVSWRTTEEDAFARILTEWLARAGKLAEHIYVINIAPTPDALDSHSPGLKASIARYNQIIAEVVAAARSGQVELVDAHRAIAAHERGLDEYLRPDGHHISRSGHRLYAGLIAAHQHGEQPVAI